MKLVNKALNKIRLLLELKGLKNRYLLLRNGVDLSEEEREEIVKQVLLYLERFENLKLIGRNGKFLYTHIHDMMKFGRDIIKDFYLPK